MSHFNVIKYVSKTKLNKLICNKVKGDQNFKEQIWLRVSVILLNKLILSLLHFPKEYHGHMTGAL